MKNMVKNENDPLTPYSCKLDIYYGNDHKHTNKDFPKSKNSEALCVVLWFLHFLHTFLHLHQHFHHIIQFVFQARKLLLQQICSLCIWYALKK